MSRVVRRALAVLALVVVLVLGWVGVRGYLAVQHLDEAAAEVADVQEQLVALEVTGAGEGIAAIRDDTSAARDLTSDPVWRFVARFPWGGQNLAVVGAGAAVGDDLARDALPSAVIAATAAAGLQDGLAASDLDASAEQATTLSDALVGLQQARDRARADLDALDRRYLAGPVRDTLAELEASLDLTEQIGAGLADVR